MINPKLIEHIFKAASMSRWNEYPRVCELSELDKQAHKFIIAYLIAKVEGGRGEGGEDPVEAEPVKMRELIERGVFDFLARVCVSDIRPDLYKLIVRERGAQLNEWTLAQLAPMIEGIEGGEFLGRFKAHLARRENGAEEEAGGGARGEAGGEDRVGKILSAASFFASRWELGLLYQGQDRQGWAAELEDKFTAELLEHSGLRATRLLAGVSPLAELVDLSGRLRLQARWAQTPRIPRTSVLGHMLVVGLLSYFYSLRLGLGEGRLVDSFYCALLHDLPEALTRDIISPVKHGVPGLDSLIIEEEIRLINSKILPLVGEHFRAEFAYLLGLRREEGQGGWVKDEFERRIFRDGRSQPLASLEGQEGGIEGRALKYCDKFAALIEAGLSLHCGVRSRDLCDGFEGLVDFFAAHPVPDGAGVDFHRLVLEFREYFEV